MTRFEDAIENALDLPSTSIPSMATKPIIPEKDSLDNNDYEYARENLYTIVEKGHDALETMLEIAKSSEHPRAFEVLSGMMKNMADINDKLMDLNKKEKELQKPETKQVGNTTNNNVFLGSTADLQKLLGTEEFVNVTPKRNISNQ